MLTCIDIIYGHFVVSFYILIYILKKAIFVKIKFKLQLLDANLS